MVWQRTHDHLDTMIDSRHVKDVHLEEVFPALRHPEMLLLIHRIRVLWHNIFPLLAAACMKLGLWVIPDIAEYD